MKRLILTIIATLFLLTRLSAYGIVNPIGGRAAAMGGSSVASQGLWALQNNPAGMANLEKLSIGLYYQNLWMVAQTAYKCAAVAIPLNFGTIGVGFNQFGGSSYNENKIGIAYARDFGRYLQIGLQLDYILFHYAEDYGNKSALTFELGLQSKVTDKLTLGAYIFNPAHLKITQTINNEPLPIAFRLGCSYRFTKDFIGQLEVEKNTDIKGVILHGGLEFEAFRDFFIRAGAQIGTDRFQQQGLLTFGLGYSVKFVEFNVSAQMHQMLGASLNIGLIFSIGK
ncbi:MAG: hypothetical protein HUK16_04770 [Bacteroidales bacterium]|nr:hypothetical protein [Bacteroidales bacterium]